MQLAYQSSKIDAEVGQQGWAERVEAYAKGTPSGGHAGLTGGHTDVQIDLINSYAF